MSDSGMPRAQARTEEKLKQRIVRLEMHPPLYRDTLPTTEGGKPWSAYVQIIVSQPKHAAVPDDVSDLSAFDPIVTRLLAEKGIEAGQGTTGVNGLRQYKVRYEKRGIEATNDVRAINANLLPQIPKR